MAHSPQEYRRQLQRRAALPAGFSAATTTLEFTSAERGRQLSMNLAALLLEEPSPAFAGVFTANRFCGAPVAVCRRRMRETQVRGVLINNRLANVGAAGGEQDAELLCEQLGRKIGCAGREILPASTGIVGWKLPVAEMNAALPALHSAFQNESALALAQAIMTTDSYPKIHREEVGSGSILGIAKGAGMIEPNMGTLLVFLLTDVGMEREQLARCLAACTAVTFNRISVDGDQSTSDIALLLSSRAKPPVEEPVFRRALERVCARLAEDVVRNGEGVGHVIRVRLGGAPSVETAVSAGKAVINSPLVKTAVFGNDPNVGRIVSALGDFCDSAGLDLNTRALRISLGGVEVFADGTFQLGPEKERRLSRYLGECALDPTTTGYPAHDRSVVLEIDLGAGAGRAEVLGADLSYQYVKENADYRS